MRSNSLGYGQLYLIRAIHPVEEELGYLYIAISEDEAWATHYDGYQRAGPVALKRSEWTIETASWTRGEVIEHHDL